MPKANLGRDFFLKSLWMSGRIGVRQRFHPSPRVQVGYSPGMQENRSEMFRGFNNFTAWGNPECPRKRISLLGFDLQMTASSPKPITQTRHSCRKQSAASQLSQPWCSSMELPGFGIPGKALQVPWSHCPQLPEPARAADFLCVWQREMQGTHPRLHCLEMQPKKSLISESWCWFKSDFE